MSKTVSPKSTFPIHFLQSDAWQKFEELEGHQTIRLEGKNYTVLAILHETPFSNYLYVPYGPSASNKTALINALKALKRFASSKDISFLRIEPTMPLGTSEMANIAKKVGLKIKKTKNLNPKHTWQLDLTPEKDLILGAINPNKTRPWRNHSKKLMHIRTSNDPSEIHILTDFLLKIGQTNSFTPQTETHLKNQLKSGFATLYIVDLAQNTQKSSPCTPIAAALVYDYGDTRYYAHAAADFDHRKLEAGSIIVLQSLLDAKESDKKFYDFWGITTSQDPKHPWYGFTKFKKAFGGQQVDYAGTYDLIIKPNSYRLYSLLRSLNRKIRKSQKSHHKK